MTKRTHRRDIKRSTHQSNSRRQIEAAMEFYRPANRIDDYTLGQNNAPQFSRPPEAQAISQTDEPISDANGSPRDAPPSVDPASDVSAHSPVDADADRPGHEWTESSPGRTKMASD